MTGAAFGTRSDIGWVTSSTLQQAGAIAVAGINVAASKSINDKQMKLAYAQLAIAQSTHDYMVNSFRPCEISALNEACSEAKHTPNYDQYAGRFATTARAQFVQAYERLEKSIHPYCSGNHKALMGDLAIAEARSVVDASNYGYRVAEARADLKNDIRWAKIKDMLSLGRGLSTSVVSHATLAGNIFSSLGKQAAASASGALWSLGYLNERKQTPLPDQPVAFKVGTPPLVPNKQEQQEPYRLSGPSFSVDSMPKVIDPTTSIPTEVVGYDNNIGAGVSGD